MILDIPYHYRAVATLRGEAAPRIVALSDRESLVVPDYAEHEAPVAVRWRQGGESDWTWTRCVDGGHAAPLAFPPESGGVPRLALAHLLRHGWGEMATEPVPANAEHVRLDDPRLVRLSEDDKGRRIQAMRARAALLCIVDGIPHAPCEEPVLVEAAGGVEVRLGRALDWARVHPLGESVGNPDIEVLVPAALRIDRDHILGKVLRKAAILVRRACGDAPEAARAADASGAALDRGDVAAAARSMAVCLDVLSARVSTPESVRDFAVRTARYIAVHARGPARLTA